MNLMSLFGAISFDPEIRGILVVLVGVVVLIGSILLIIATNTGARLGFLVTAAGFFGWMFLLSLIWWMYGIGFVGREAAWTGLEVNYSRDTALATTDARDLLPPDELPEVDALVDDHPLILAIGKGLEGEGWAPESLTDLVTVATPLVVLEADDITDAWRESVGVNAEAVLAANSDVQATLSMDSGDLADAVNEAAIDLRGAIEDPLGDWCILPGSDPRRGEAQAASDALLVEEHAFGDQTSSADYTIYDVFLKGGKQDCRPTTEPSTLTQAWNRVKSIAEVKNPPQYAAVTQQKVIPPVLVAGEAPPPAEIDAEASVVSTVMIRNLGNKRLIPAVLAVLTLLLFAVFVVMLNHRDDVVHDAEAAFKAGG